MFEKWPPNDVDAAVPRSNAMLLWSNVWVSVARWWPDADASRSIGPKVKNGGNIVTSAQIAQFNVGARKDSKMPPSA